MLIVVVICNNIGYTVYRLKQREKMIMISVSEIKECLCINDKRNPNYYEDEFIIPVKTKICFCDNCFYGRTELAEYILELIEGAIVSTK